MATFTIDTDNNIAAHAAVPANIDNLQAFALKSAEPSNPQASCRIAAVPGPYSRRTVLE